MPDHIIVGAGLSGIAVAEELLKRGKSIKIFDNSSQFSSTVAGGIFNPVILKRFTLAWESDKQLETAISFYRSLSEKLGVNLLHEMPVFRRFHSVEEQNDWFEAMDKPALSPFLDPNLVAAINPNIPGDFSFGKVNGTGVVNTSLLLDVYKNCLKQKDIFIYEDFQYGDLKIDENQCYYKNLVAKSVIFCDGFGVRQNKFFKYLPLNGNKGEYIIIKSEELQLKVAVKASVFILPLVGDLYKVGATYNNHDKTPQPSLEARKYLEEKLNCMITCEYEIVDQVAGIRPSTADRKPLVGRHPEFENLYCCNGFGSRGVLIGPTVAKHLVELLENERPLPQEINIERFRKNYKKQNS